MWFSYLHCANLANISQAVQGSNAAPSDPGFVPLTADRLNTESAGHPRVTASTIYATAGWSVDWCTTPLLGLGVSYEISHNKQHALQQWVVWANVSLSY